MTVVPTGTEKFCGVKAKSRIASAVTTFPGEGEGDGVGDEAGDGGAAVRTGVVVATGAAVVAAGALVAAGISVDGRGAGMEDVATSWTAGFVVPVGAARDGSEAEEGLVPSVAGGTVDVVPGVAVVRSPPEHAVNRPADSRHAAASRSKPQITAASWRQQP